MAVTQQLTFEPGQSLVNITIPIITDTIREDDETFTVSIVPNPNIIPPEDDPVVTVIEAGKNYL